MASAGNRASPSLRYQSLWDLPHPKPASVRVPRRSSGYNVDLTLSVSPVFELPDELILSILSCVSPDPQLTGYYARFRVQYCMGISDYHQQRVRFLLSLSMTCRAMRLRLLPWIWECVERLMFPNWSPGPEGGTPGKFSATIGTLRTDILLAASVKYVCAMLLPRVSADS